MSGFGALLCEVVIGREVGPVAAELFRVKAGLPRLPAEPPAPPPAPVEPEPPPLPPVPPPPDPGPILARLKLAETAAGAMRYLYNLERVDPIANRPAVLYALANTLGSIAGAYRRLLPVGADSRGNEQPPDAGGLSPDGHD